jgi:hypothetical protein
MARTLGDIGTPATDELTALLTLGRGSQLQNPRVNPPDPVVDTFADRFGQWTPQAPSGGGFVTPDLINLLLQEQQRGTRTMRPGEQFPDPLGYRGQPFLNWFLQRRV